MLRPSRAASMTKAAKKQKWWHWKNVLWAVKEGVLVWVWQRGFLKLKTLHRLALRGTGFSVPITLWKDTVGAW